MTTRQVAVPGHPSEELARAAVTVPPPAEPAPPTGGGGGGPVNFDSIRKAKDGTVWEKTTLDALGPHLPIGFLLPGGGRSRLFRFRPYRLKEQKLISEMKEKAKGLTAGKLVSDVLSVMVQTVGPHSFDTMNDQERALVIAQMYLTDVLYLYMYLRHEALHGEPMVATMPCPACKWSNRFEGDLKTLEVRKVPDADADGRPITDMRWIHELEDGFVLRGERRTQLLVEPTRWMIFEDPSFQNQATRDVTMIINSVTGIQGINAYPYRLSDAEVDEYLTKFDYEGLVAEIEQQTPGPQMAVNTKCEKCHTELFQIIDWTRESFFARSSPRRNGKA